MITTSPLLIVLLLQCGEHFFFRVEDVGRAGELQALFAGDLGHRALGAKLAAHDADVAGRFDRVGHGPYHFLPVRLSARQIGQVFGDRFSGNGQTIAVEQALGQQQLHYRRRAANLVQVFLNIFAARFQDRPETARGR